MTAINSEQKEFREALTACATSYQVDLSAESLERLSEYYVLLTRWNPRLHLVAPCPPREFAIRHVLESLMLLPHLPQGAKVADVGSGAGLPVIPCLIARPDITATLIESSKKKAVFLREALNHAEVSNSTEVIAERFEEIPAPEANFVTCRALDHFEAQLPSLLKWSPREAYSCFSEAKDFVTRSVTWISGPRKSKYPIRKEDFYSRLEENKEAGTFSICHFLFGHTESFSWFLVLFRGSFAWPTDRNDPRNNTNGHEQEVDPPMKSGN